MYQEGSKLQFVSELLHRMKTGDQVTVHFTYGISSEIIRGREDNCSIEPIELVMGMTNGMFRSYAARIANKEGMVIKTKTTESGKFLFIWRVY